MKQTIEVEVGPEDDAGTCLVVLGGTRHERWDRATVERFGLAIPDPAPARTEYRLSVVHPRGLGTEPADEVLVAAHSLRVGDRIEWAPGDWREIAKVELNDPEHAIHTFYVGDQRATYRGWDLVAVRR